MNDEKITQILVEMQALRSSQDEMVRDLKYHIKRTDMLEQKTNRIIYLLVLGAGASLSTFGPSILKVLGFM